MFPAIQSWLVCVVPQTQATLHQYTNDKLKGGKLIQVNIPIVFSGAKRPTGTYFSGTLFQHNSDMNITFRRVFEVLQQSIFLDLGSNLLCIKIITIKHHSLSSTNHKAVIGKINSNIEYLSGDLCCYKNDFLMLS